MEQKRKIYHFQEKKLIFSRPISHLMWNAHEFAMSLLMNFDELEDEMEPKDLNFSENWESQARSWLLNISPISASAPAAI